MRRLCIGPVALLLGVSACASASDTTGSSGAATVTTADTTVDDEAQATSTAPGTDLAVPSGVRAPSGQAPLRVTIIGDSVMFDASLGIEHSLEATGNVVTQSRAIGAVGLSVDGWSSFIDEVLDDTKPELIVMMIGGWDLGVVEFEGVDAYRPMVDEAIATMTGRGAHLIWLGMPPTPPAEGLEAHRQVVNRVYADAAAGAARVTYVDTNEVLGDPEGEFARYLVGPDGSEVQARKVRDGRDDGHLCAGGAAILGELAFDTLSTLTTLAPRGDWLAGDWTSDGRYDDPPEGCAG